MAYNAAYASVAELNAVCDEAISAPIAQRKLDAASRWLEWKLEVESFNLSEAASARVVYAVPDDQGLGTRVLDVPPIGAADGLVVKVDSNMDGTFGEAAVPASSYQLWPLSAAYGPEPEAWTQLALPAWSTLSSWPLLQPIEVTARWGYPAVPAAVKDFVIEAAKMLLGVGIYSTGTIPEMDQVETASPQARAILKQLTMRYAPYGGIGIG